jgi:hypothetical protein
MRTLRVSLFGLMGFVLAVAVALAAFRNANQGWAGVFYLLTWAVLSLSVVGAICRKGTKRAWWLGFALFGWGYLSLVFLPSDERMKQFRLPTTDLLKRAHAYLETSGGGLAGARPGSSEGTTMDGQRPIVTATTLEAVLSVTFQFAGCCWSSFGSGQPTPERDPFIQVGHCILAQLAAVLGGILAAVSFRSPAGVSLAGQELVSRKEDSGQSRRFWCSRLGIFLFLGIALVMLIGLAAMRSESPVWPEAMFFGTCAWLGLAVVGAICGFKGRRAAWMGAALIGWGYLFLAFHTTAFHSQHCGTPEVVIPRYLLPWQSATVSSHLPRRLSPAPGNGPSPLNAPILNALEQNVPMPYASETELKEVLGAIRGQTKSRELPDGIPIYVDPIGLQEAEKTLSSPITIDVRGVPLRVSLGLALEQLELRYFVRDGLMLITSETSAADLAAAYDPFVRVGHCLVALIAGLLGGAAAGFLDRPGRVV